MFDKKMSEFDEVTEMPDNSFIPVIDESGEPKLNKKISKENLALAINGAEWYNGGQITVADFQAGDEVDGNPNVYEITLDAIPEGAIISALALRNDENLAGPELDDQDIELFNDDDNFVANNLLENWTEGDEKPNVQTTIVGYKEKSGKMFTTGIVYKLRLTTDIPIANLTNGKFTFLYKLETLPFDIES